ncbi:hypothetical protein CTheo_1734 [Ceratobasidium theobromae]|uniref:Uncharacterized protein n=1 Tax=Ceratobasidium theobromae TaxID=1582974 RepID=A0A5N5QSN3_9AGAM|nr:hypothetical protein CTheo_1734 [Ceratobasidium theobromae]
MTTPPPRPNDLYPIAHPGNGSTGPGAQTWMSTLVGKKNAKISSYALEGKKRDNRNERWDQTSCSRVAGDKTLPPRQRIRNIADITDPAHAPGSAMPTARLEARGIRSRSIKYRYVQLDLEVCQHPHSLGNPMRYEPSSSVEWHYGRLSCRLRTIACKGKDVLPNAFCDKIEITALRVLAHEERIYEHTISNSTTDPDFIHTGYAKAFAPLLRYMLDPDSRVGMHGIQLHVCTQLLVHLRRILAVLKARGSDSCCITYNTAVNVLVSQIDQVL